MNRGVIIHLDNEKSILERSLSVFQQNNFDLDYIICSTKEEFNKAIEQYRPNIKALIFDLLSKDANPEEFSEEQAQFLENLYNSFVAFNVPIFVYSGYLQALGDKFDNSGTVYKIDKDQTLQLAFDKFRILYESGFVDVFCPGGSLITHLSADLHKAFTKQFMANGEIEKIINQIKGNASYQETSPRIQKVFKRIAVRTLLSELLSPDLSDDGILVEETVNTMEHYIRRISKMSVWTGDLFKRNNADDFLFILTPRCNVLRTDLILVCPFIWKEVITKSDKISKMLQGDPTVSGYDRHLPPSPIFEGGKLSLAKYFMINREQLLAEYQLYISLSDELTNEIIGKFGAHFFRTGITPWDPAETAEQIKTQ